jgi:TonB-linked SusC/RagA family outer membrane protein
LQFGIKDTNNFKTIKIMTKVIKFFRKIIYIVAIAFSSPLFAQQESIKIEGRVIDEKTQKPVIGASVSLANEKLISVTDVDGYFLLHTHSLPAILSVKYLGYKPQEIDIYEYSEPLTIFFREDLNTLNEIVVVGYGTQKRRELTGSIASIPADALKAVPVASVDNALQGAVAGVQVSQISGQPGGRVSIRVRGAGSIQGGNEPLYVVDGFPFYNETLSAGTLSGSDINPLASINPGDIESIDILKDAAATAIYGSRGANGVVIITTKQGKSEKNSITYDFSIGVQSLRKKIDLLNAHDFAILRNDALYDAYPTRPGGQYQYKTPEEIALLGEGTDWQDAAFRSAQVQNHQLSITGGSEKTQYAISGNYYNQEGIITNTDFQRLSGRVNIYSQVYSKLKVGLNLNTGHTKSNVAPSGIVSNLLTMPPTATIYEPDGSYTLQNPFENIFSNPIASLHEQKNKHAGYQLMSSIYGEYSFIKDLTLKVLFGANVNNNKEYNYVPGIIYEGVSKKGAASLGHVSSYSWLNENTLSYAQSYKDKHFFNFLLGFTQQESRRENFRAGASNFINDYLLYNSLGSGSVTTKPSSDVEASQLLSYLGRINYNWGNKYFLSVSLRGDGSSRFGKTKKWGYFPSAGASWLVSDEAFFKPLNPLVDNLKIRLSYGKTGNQEIGSYQSHAILSSIGYMFGGEAVTGFRPNQLGNDNLGWETTHQTDVGVDISLFKSRLTLIVDTYIKRTTDLLLDVQIPWTTGFGSLLQNYGSVENRGWEFAVSTQNLRGKFSWNTAFNLSLNRNKVLEIGSSGSEIVGSAQYNSGNFLVKVGEPLGTIYGCVTDGILQTGEETTKGKYTGNATPKAGDRLYKDVSGNGSFTTAEDRTIIGSAQPDFIFGLTNSFQYKDLALSFVIQGSVGNDVINNNRQTLELFNGQQNAAGSARDRWTPDNPSTAIPRAKLDPAPVFSDRYVEDGTFVRLKNVNLSYSLPKNALRAIKLSHVRLHITGHNLLTFTRYTGFDPEVTSSNNTTNQGYDSGIYPVARSVSAGINVTF